MRLLLLLLGFAISGPTMAQAQVVVTDTLYKVSLAEGFDAARETLEWAITNQGLVISHRSQVSEMLQRTARDLGGSPIYRQAEVLEFCSAGLSRQMMAANPDHIVFCPFTIAVYQLDAEPGRSWLAFQRPPASAGEPLKAVERLLSAILEEAAGL